METRNLREWTGKRQLVIGKSFWFRTVGLGFREYRFLVGKVGNSIGYKGVLKGGIKGFFNGSTPSDNQEEVVQSITV